MKSQAIIAIGVSKMKPGLTTTISGISTAAEIAARATTSSLWRLTRRSRPSYSSGGICCVFHAR